jgi:hypothetical protein
MTDDKQWLDASILDPVYVDGVGSVFNLGGNFGTVFFRFLPVRSGGGIIYERSPVLYIVRPMSSLDPNDPIRGLLATQPAPGGLQHPLN